jgi:hypothetical protein
MRNITVSRLVRLLLYFKLSRRVPATQLTRAAITGTYESLPVRIIIPSAPTLPPTYYMSEYAHKDLRCLKDSWEPL